MKKIALIILCAFLVIVSSCQKKQDDQKRQKEISLIEGWFPWTGYIGGLFAEEIADSLYGLQFKIVDGADNIDPVQMVLSDQYLFGVAGAEAIVAANLNTNADLVAIGVVNYKSATCFLSLKEKNIHSVKDFQGKKIGVLLGTETETIYQALKKKNGISAEEENVPFDLQTFLLGKYDVRPGFTYDEEVTLQMKNKEYNIIYPQDYGVSILGGVYFTRKKTIEQYPELVQQVVSSIALGWEKALLDPNNAVQLLINHDPKNLDEKREKLAFEKGAEYFRGEDDWVLYASDRSWNNFNDVLKLIGRVPKDFDISKCYDNSFVMNFHKKTKPYLMDFHKTFNKEQ